MLSTEIRNLRRKFVNDYFISEPDQLIMEGISDKIEQIIDLNKNLHEKYQKCIRVIKRFDAGIIGMYDL